MKVALVIGTRPQIIKSAPIIHASKNFPELDFSIVHTGQHYDYEMSKVFFFEMNLPDPRCNLGIGSGTHAWQTGNLLMKLEETFQEYKPDVVLVPGDTNSTLAGALAAAKMGIPVAHLESGARSFDLGMPEEVNRRLTDHCSDTLFTVSEWCRNQLLKEGIRGEDVFLVGDTMYESIEIHQQDIEGNDILERVGMEEPYYVLTVHRAENTDSEERLKGIFKTILELDHNVIFPCHPRTRERLVETGLMEAVESSSNLELLDPVSYYSMLRLIRDAEITFTDSGGIQKEAYWLNTPCITLRYNTEWRETMAQDMNKLVGADPNRIIEAVKFHQKNRFIPEHNSYNFGGASKQILEVLSVRYP
jgi:UDP-N-acetylglucosamine 2-epimerase (non-hydrolysing)